MGRHPDLTPPDLDFVDYTLTIQGSIYVEGFNDEKKRDIDTARQLLMPYGIVFARTKPNGTQKNYTHIRIPSWWMLSYVKATPGMTVEEFAKRIYWHQEPDAKPWEGVFKLKTIAKARTAVNRLRTAGDVKIIYNEQGEARIYPGTWTDADFV